MPHNLLRLAFTILFFWWQVCPTVAQLKPTKTEAVITFMFQNPANQLAAAGKKFKIEGQKSKKTVHLETDTSGKASVLVAVNDIYAIHLSDWENFASVTIPKGEYQRHEIPVPFYEIPQDGSPILAEIPVHIRLVNQEGKHSNLIEPLTIRSGNTRKTYQITTDKHGIATLKLPIGCQYVLSLENAPNYYKFEIPNKPYAAWSEDVLFERIKGMDKYPSINQALFNFIFYDLEGNLVEGERFWVTSEKDAKKYEGITNQQGIAQILVPLNDTYVLNATYNLGFGRQKVFLEEGSDIIVETIEYESVSSKSWVKRQSEQELASAKRDSINKAIAIQQEALVDSLKNSEMEDKIIKDLVENNRSIPIKRTFTIRKAVKAKVEYIEQQIKINPNYFEDAEKPILATLQRFKESWKGKVVVTDVTYSMNNYLEEVLIWHSLNLRKGEHTKYFFFNDGDKKTIYGKRIGSTGGIYSCEGAWEELPKVIETMHVAIESGIGGGEPPENDLEAVLAAIKQGQNVSEVILIADSYSRVRDMELLSQIKIPVRIILCGADEKNTLYKGSRSDINEEYLTIAHRTKGSIHTLRQDILDLSERKDGEIVEIGAHRYILRNKQFIKLSNE